MKMWMLKALAVGSLVCAGCGAGVTVATEEASVEPTTSSSEDVEAPKEDTDPTPENAEPTPDAEPTPEQAEPTPEQAGPTPGDDGPPADDTDTVAAEIAGSVGLTALAEDLPEDAIECAIEGLLDNRELARAVILAGDDDLLADLSPELADQAIDIVLDCTDDETFAALIVAGFEEDGNDLPDGVAPCFAAELDTDEERRALVKAGLADEGDVDAETVALVVDAVASCIPPGAWVELMISEVGEDDELFEQAISTSCLETLFADDDFVEGLLTAAFNGDFDDDNVITPTQEPLIRGLFDCLDFGTVIAAEAAADGIELSSATVDCMSDAFRDLGLVESFISGDEPSDDELGAVIFDCLSVDELRELAAG